jgi:hypothetical protein
MNQLLKILMISGVLVTSIVMADEEAAVPAGTADKNVELMQQAADGEVAMPRPSPNTELPAADPSTSVEPNKAAQHAHASFSQKY